MEKEKKSNKTPWYIKWMIALLVLILLAAGIRFALKSDRLFDYARDYALKQTNQQLNGELQIDEIRGDLLFGFTLKGIVLRDENGETLVHADSIRVAYTLPSVIFSPHRLDQLHISGASVYAEQYADSVWNFETLVPPAERDEPDDDPLYWSLDRLTIENSYLSVISEHLLPDGQLRADNIEFTGGAEMLRRGWSTHVNNLSLRLNEERLPEPIDFALRGLADEELITLESLVINSGRSFLTSSLEIDEADRVSGRAVASPLSHRDLAAYIDELPLEQNLNITMNLSGSLSDLEIEIHAEANGLENLTLNTVLDLSGPYALKLISLDVTGLNPSLLTGIDDLPSLRSFRFDGSGNIPFDEPETAEWNGTLAAGNITLDENHIDSIESEFSLQQGHFSLAAEFMKQQDGINLAAEISNIFNDIPEWHADLTAPRMNLAVWLDDPGLDSSLPLTASAAGSGYDPENLQVSLDLAIEDGRFGGQHFNAMSFTGNVSPAMITGDFVNILEESRLLANFTIRNWREEQPDYTFAASLHSFNTAELDGLEDFPTYLNGTLTGSGTGFDPETLFLTATAQLDTSVVNRDRIETLRAEFEIRNSFLTIDNAQLESPIADANFSLKQNILEFQHPDNTLEFSSELKDLTSLAPLFGFEDMGAEGTIEGNLARNATGILVLRASLELENVFADTLFASEKISGTAGVLLAEDPEIEAGFEFTNPLVAGYAIGDLTVEGFTTISDPQITGGISFEIFDEESSLMHSGRFVYADDELTLTTTLLNFNTPQRSLALDHPFDLFFAEQSLRVDTLRMQTGDGEAYLELWVPQADSLRQSFGLNAQLLNIGVLQNIFMEEAIVNGLLSGEIRVDHSPDSLTFRTDVFLEQMQYEQGEMDSIRIAISAQQEWLNLDIAGWHMEKKLFESKATVPFVPGDPLTFDDQFFDREIEGEFYLFESELPYWLGFLPDSEQYVEDSEGTVSFRGFMSGLAGEPEFSGSFKITDGVLSGIPVDSVGVDIAYRHEISQAALKGTVVSRQNPVLEFDSRIPFKLDLQALEIGMPDDDDEIFTELTSTDFNLALFNDFTDRENIRQIEGRLNGSIQISGPVGNLHTSGHMELTGGSVRIVPAGITLGRIESRITLTPEQATLEYLNMHSGPGRITASGTIELDNMTPGDINLQMNGRQFRAANTPQYNAIIDFDTRLNGTFEQPNLEGSLTFLSGFVNLQNFGDRAVEAVELEDEEPAEPFTFYEAMAIEMDVNFGRQFIIRNRQYLDMEIELGGQVDLVKLQDDELQLFGTVEGVRGFARPMGRNFVIDEAFVTFSGPAENPGLNIRTVYQPPQAQMEVSIYYIIEGTLEDPEFRFESEPQMELQDIISYTVFGRPFYELESWEQVVAGSGGGPTAADVALDVLLDRVELLAAQRLGIDVVQIDNSRSGSDSNTSILTGWYLNRRTFFAVINEVSANPKTLFLLEYMLLENLELIVTQGDDSRQGFDLRWNLDY